MTNIFHSWLRAMAKYLSAFVYMPDMEHILGTTPQRFREFKNLCGIIDCSEIFAETPKDLEMQIATRSEYHNTVKFLICVAPNSGITFISKAHTGRLSDKKITLKSGFLDHVRQFTTIMADKGFNLIDECSARYIYFEVPPRQKWNNSNDTSSIDNINDTLIVCAAICNFKEPLYFD